MFDDDKLLAIINDHSRESRLGNDEGPVIPTVLVGYRTATLSGQSALMKFEVVVQGQPQTIVFPIAMSRSQCTELSAALSRLATLPRKASDGMN